MTSPLQNSRFHNPWSGYGADVLADEHATLTAFKQEALALHQRVKEKAEKCPCYGETRQALLDFADGLDAEIHDFLTDALTQIELAQEEEAA